MCENYKWVFLKTQSIVTDGTSVNTGYENSLWRLIDEAMEGNILLAKI